MADVSELHLVPNRCGGMSLVHEGRACAFEKRSAEETKPIPAIYDEEASAASAEPSTSGYFPPFKRVKSTMYSHRAKRFPKLPNHRQDLQIPVPFRTTIKADDDFLLWQSASRHILVFATGYNIRLLAAMRTWGMNGTFKIVPQWYQQLFTIHAFAAGKLVPAVYCLCTDKDIGTYGFKSQALISRAAALEVDLNPDTIICDFETALIPAIQDYFPNARELMTDERLPLWNVHRVNIRTNNHLEGWHNRLNRKADKSHNGLYELLQLLIAEQGVMDTLIQQVLSGNATVGDLRRANRVYAQKQRRVAQYTAECTNGRRTLEQFLEALIVHFQVICWKIDNLSQKSGIWRQQNSILSTSGARKVTSKNMMLFYEGRVHFLKHTNFEEKQWICSRVRSGCRGTVYTNLEVSTVSRTEPHAETCTADDSLLYKIEKRNTLKRRAGEETKPVTQIYREESSIASTNVETAGQFPPFKKVKSAMYRSRAKRFS
ncbi:hypothetical protein T07_4504 [Trichinella nelsoni]|uniref:Uncharacterized protein n=1 Tax=Trichinella nelsoni TaxID=6336 RepID=A0A0V0S9X5_9BILA|nr:hypothetical protein T07_4504 [Trichinella nelsoni]